MVVVAPLGLYLQLFYVINSLDKRRLGALKRSHSNDLYRYSLRPGASLGLHENSIWVSTRSALEVIQIEIWIQDLFFFSCRLSAGV